MICCEHESESHHDGLCYFPGCGCEGQKKNMKDLCPMCQMNQDHNCRWGLTCRQVITQSRIIEIAEKALKSVDDYFKALRECWLNNQGKVVSESGIVVEGNDKIEILCDKAGCHVIEALEEISKLKGQP